MSIGYTEIILIVLVILLLFGAKRIPELARALGKAKKEFQKAKDEVETEVEEVSADDDPKKTEEKKES
ncbi:twin-arginine translocase TatA/TatE family subunit [bacterium]|nr:twin-arginine translocase TatA/TatE family subunit [bacterium]MBR5901811.1 twin-arginine translocase TatA/TatE family subunit [bacterium]